MYAELAPEVDVKTLSPAPRAQGRAAEPRKLLSRYLKVNADFFRPFGGGPTSVL